MDPFVYALMPRGPTAAWLLFRLATTYFGGKRRLRRHVPQCELTPRSLACPPLAGSLRTAAGRARSARCRVPIT